MQPVSYVSNSGPLNYALLIIIIVLARSWAGIRSLLSGYLLAPERVFARSWASIRGTYYILIMLIYLIVLILTENCDD